MLPEELLKKVRQIEITTRKVVDDLMSGQYKSRFKGHGVQFSEHRQYYPGDDVRHIDWKVSARTRDPLIKKYDEERELTVFIIVDVSGSEEFASQGGKLKSEIAAELAGLLAYAAIHSGDRVGALFFAGEVEKIIPPKRGNQHVLRIVREVLGYQPRTRGTALGAALDAAGRVMKHSGVIFVISDFLASGYDRQLRKLAKKHDVVAIGVGDRRENEMPDLGMVLLEDPESGESHWVDTGSYAFKKWFEKLQAERAGTEREAFKGRAEMLRVHTSEDYGAAVTRFFQARARRASGRG